MPLPQPLQRLNPHIRYPPPHRLRLFQTTNLIVISRHNQRRHLQLLILERRLQFVPLQETSFMRQSFGRRNTNIQRRHLRDTALYQ